MSCTPENTAIIILLSNEINYFMLLADPSLIKILIGERINSFVYKYSKKGSY